MVQKAAKIIGGSERLVVLTGAGISQESGIPTFRGTDGLWRKYRAEELATPEAFAQDPVLVWEWYDMRRQKVAASEPNPGHLAIADLERILPDVLVVTQNVDGLHRAAGSTQVCEIHGNLMRARCVAEAKTVEDLPIPLEENPPRCSCGAHLRPDVVWFGESIPEQALRTAWHAAGSCDVMLVAGTSALVQPASLLPLIARDHGASIVEVNIADTPLTQWVDAPLRGKCSEVLPEVVRLVRESVESV